MRSTGAPRGGWVPRGRAGWPLRPSHAVAAVVVLAVALAGAAAWAWWSRARPAPSMVTLSTGTPALVSPSPSPRPSQIVVHVIGLVARPGVVRLPAGSRVGDAVRAAGGVRRGSPPVTVNLARPLTDGEQVVVGADPPTDGGAAAGAAATGPIDLNAATVEQLDSLPGVGPVLAQRIVDWRSAHGRFTTVEELREVSGVGDRKFEDLAPRVRV